MISHIQNSDQYGALAFLCVVGDGLPSSGVSFRLQEAHRQDLLRLLHQELPNHFCYHHDGGPCEGYGVWASGLDGGERVSWEQGG